ncbi:aminopeptidase N [Candidatus Amarobacter glycogenicus]|uniref:aminopeptidase N n=1 Tax=Candidatus Amarobacter glycogenicus TaxID=3140699 RepID=UPI0031353407|nr:aminopeptidase N [Dehalococcoidia bacterium]
MTISTPELRDNLTQAEAEARALRVSGCEYTIAIELTRGAGTYRGDTTLRFDAAGSGDLFLDFRGKSIELLEVNDRPLEPNWNGYRLWLPAASVSKSNTVRVVYENEYDHEGDGFHQFKDPEDGEEYLYSNFEPYESHRLFPQFDQPDIKGTYGLTVLAPAEWEVVANSRETSAEPRPDGRTLHAFEATQPFSTYLFALVVGPYHVARERHGSVDIGLFCRKSLAKHLDTQELFEVTRQGLDFYAAFFDFPYPFGKYDQIFVPEFNSGAMENVGCVTHNEYMVFRDPPTENQRRGRAETVLHEMAHMWFGDLVTMRWWNDLWLNESFATYMSYLCMDDATRFKTGWQDFASGMKNWAYRQDQLVTTHPIAGQVEDTDQTFLNFDGITYGKGASVLKQLVKAIGLDGFREGMRHYFRTHAYGNATLSQFLGSLEKGSGVDLKEWARLWLETPSLNTIGARWEADGDRISQFSLGQTAPEEYPTIRPHRIDIGLVRDVQGKLEISVVPASIATAEAEVTEARGLPRPSLVFPNYGDHGYAKIALDAESLTFLKGNMQRIEDALLRLQLWGSLWSMVRDQQLRSTEYLELVRAHITREAMPELVEAVVNNATAAAGRYVPEEWKAGEAHSLARAAYGALKAAGSPDLQIIWVRALIANAVVPEDLALVARLADGEEAVEGLMIDQDMRWSIAAKHVAYGMPGAAERVTAEAQRDPSDRGVRAKLRCETSSPAAEAKASAWERFNGEGYGSLYLTGAAMSGFNWAEQREVLEPYVEAYFGALPNVFRTKDKEFASDYFRALFPGYRVERELLSQSEAVLAGYGDELPVLARMVREANDDLLRAIRCREFAAG